MTEQTRRYRGIRSRRCWSWSGNLVEFGAREIEEDGLGLVFQFLFLEDDAMRMQELVGDVGEDSGAARGDAAFSHLDEEAGKEFPQVSGGRELGEAVKEIFREVGGVIWE